MVTDLGLLVELYKDKYKKNKPFPHIRLGGLFPDDLLNDVVENIFKIKDDVNWQKMCTADSDFSEFGESAVELTDYLISDKWVKFLSRLCDVRALRSDPDWYASGINFEPRGASLGPHTDFNILQNRSAVRGEASGWRRVNLLLFLSKNWKKTWGGQNELGRLVKNQYIKDKSYNPDFNTAVIFNTSDDSFHGFDVVKCPDNTARIVISCYYYSDYQGPHSDKKYATRYVGWDNERDTDVEYEKRRGTYWRKES